MSTTPKAAVVTGGAQGLGRAICLALAALTACGIKGDPVAPVPSTAGAPG